MKSQFKLAGNYTKDDRKGTIDEVSKPQEDVKTGLLHLARDKLEDYLFIDQAASGTEMA